MPFFKSGSSANDVSEEALKERSYLWMARAFGLICVVTLIADFILFSALDSLLPLVRVQPFFITTQDKDRQIIKIDRLPTQTLRSEVLQESFVRQYLLARFGMGSDVKEIERRWGPGGTIQWMSSDSVFNEFLRNYATGLIEKANQEGLTREVDILNIRRIPRNDGQVHWQAEVRLLDMSRSAPEKQVTEWQVDMGIRFGELRSGLTWDQRLKNPLGFRVEVYGQRLKSKQ